jgi:hypothetical protein
MHVIRLHGPWMADDATGSRRVHLPRDWSELGELARLRPLKLVRRFHRPTGLADATRVRLAIPQVWPISAVRVNGMEALEHVAVDDRRLFDLSGIIRACEAHDLEIEFCAGDGLAGQPYFVAIEIEEQA